MLLIQRHLGLLVGPQEMGRTWHFWVGFMIVIAVGAAAPEYLSRFDLLNLSNFITSVFLGLSLCLIWGFCGILSLGQAAFLGVGGYAYGVAGINFMESHGNTWAALGIGLAVPVLLAAVLGFIMFYARLKGVYVAILMLLVTLLFETFLNQTAGQGWFIGDAHLGGNNGLGRFSGVIRRPPSLDFSLSGEGIKLVGKSHAFFYFTFGLAVICYLGLRVMVNSKLGFVMVAIREDSDRTEALGYDVRLVQLIVFCVSALLASMSGILYVSWGRFITPDVFGVYNNVLPVIWVAVAGRKSLTATVIGTLVLVWMSQRLTETDYAFVVLGGILLGAMLLLPEGVITGLVTRSAALRARLSARKGS